MKELDGEQVLMEEIAERTISLVRSLDPALSVRFDQEQSFCAIQLPPARDAEYRFALYFYENGEPQICATLVSGDPRAYFWHWPFEEPDFDTSAERECAFLAAVRQVLASHTRIRQKRGLLTTQFQCETRDGDRWYQVGPCIAGLRWGTKAPPIKHKVVYYESPALILV